MKKKTYLVVVVSMALMGLSGCASVPSNLSLRPVVAQGHKSKIPPSERITHIPAGTKIPLRMVSKGDVFRHAVEKTVWVTLKEDVYIYGKDEKMWVSYDRKQWKPIMEAFDVALTLDTDITTQHTKIQYGIEINKIK